MRLVTTGAVVAALASLMLALAGPAEAKRLRGTKGPDRLVGTAKADTIRGLRGSDRIRGRGGRDRLLGGRGADRLNAVDGRRDRAVRGGRGRDVCRIDAADRPKTKGCEVVKVRKRRGGGGGPGSGPGPGPPDAGLTCAIPPEGAKLAGDQQPTFSDEFYAITVTINASADGMTGNDLPISIEEVCDVPSRLAGEAAQLIGGDGVAVVSSATKVYDATGRQLSGGEAMTALAGADSVSLKARLERPAGWRQDEDGEPVPTFAISRADITD
jgi:RTX calcium-binding nonapeptide repeat (4 copies)